MNGPVCKTALKEWAAAIRALETGAQMLLIRKGGLKEPQARFAFRSRSFLLFPGFEHQNPEAIREPYRHFIEDSKAYDCGEGLIGFALYAEVAQAWEVADARALDAVRAFHIYTPEFLGKRLHWRPGEPYVVACVRAYRLEEPSIVPMREVYAGCTSWVELEESVALGSKRAVVAEGGFGAALDEIRAALA